MKQINCLECYNTEGISNLNLTLEFQISASYISYYKAENLIKFLSPSLLVQISLIESVRGRMENEFDY